MNDETLILMNDCENRSHKLNSWEKDFITDIRKQHEKGRKLSEAQEDTLNRLWEKATS